MPKAPSLSIVNHSVSPMLRIPCLQAVEENVRSTELITTFFGNGLDGRFGLGILLGRHGWRSRARRISRDLIRAEQGVSAVVEVVVVVVGEMEENDAVLPVSFSAAVLGGFRSQAPSVLHLPALSFQSDCFIPLHILQGLLISFLLPLQTSHSSHILYFCRDRPSRRWDRPFPTMKLLTSSLLQSLLLLSTSLAPVKASDSSESLSPCVARSPTTGLYYDLNTISLAPPELRDGEKVHKGAREESWQARGHDYPANFTINVCAPVIENIQDVVGVEKSRWKNVSAYYEKSGKIYSLGYVFCLSQLLHLILGIEMERGKLISLGIDNKHPIPSSVAANWS